MARDEDRPDHLNSDQLGGSEPAGGEPAGVGDSEGVEGTEGAEAADASGEELTVEEILSAAQTASAAGADGADGAEEAEASVDEGDENPHLEDLRRLSAEYANYRKRTEANIELEQQRAKAAAVASLLPVVDDLDRAEQHGDLEEGTAFATIAQKIRGVLERMGLESFGEKGEPFDPQVHEAIAQVPVPGTENPTVMDVVERGYRIGDVELRPAKVAVAVEADG